MGPAKWRGDIGDKMRLTCPNCSARYEVDESMIPPAGRDVQCSNCGTTWFQPGPRDAEADDAAEAPEVEAAVETPAEEPEPAPPEDPPAEVTDEDQAPDVPERPRRPTIDSDVANILRQEAEREAELRRAETQPEPVETQEEMPLEDTEPRRQPMADDDASDQDEEPPEVAPTPTSRGELLPDIEEINSTLRATGDRSETEPDATDADTVGSTNRRRGQARRGFFLMLLIALVVVLLYAQADTIRTAVPQAAPLVDSYVSAINSARFWLDDLAQSVGSQSGE